MTHYPYTLGLCWHRCPRHPDDTEAELTLRRDGEVRSRCLACGLVTPGLALAEVEGWVRGHRAVSA